MTSPSPGADRDRPKRADLLLPWEIVVAPARAFERIAIHPEWIVAYLVLAALMIVTGVLEYPAVLHVQSLTAHAARQDPIDPHEFLFNFLGNMILNPLISIMFEAIAIAIFAATRDVKNFAKYPAFVSLAANTAIIWAIGEVAKAFFIHARSAASFTDYRSLNMALPLNMTFLADPANANQVAFLSAFGVFDTWGTIVLAYGLSRIANIAIVPSLIFVFALDVAFAYVYVMT